MLKSTSDVDIVVLILINRIRTMSCTIVCCVQVNRKGVLKLHIAKENNKGKWAEILKNVEDFTPIDAQIRLVRSVDGCTEYLTYFVDVELLIAFIENHDRV